MLAPWKKLWQLWKPRQHIKKQRHYFADKGPSSQSCGFSSSHVHMWKLDHNEGLAPKNWCLQTVELEKTLESPLDWKDIKSVNPKGNQPLIFIRRSDAEAEADILATWCKDLTHWKRPWCWERLKAGGEGDDRGRDAWVASPTQWTRVWANSRRWWRTGKPGVLQSMGSQRVGHDEWLNNSTTMQKIRALTRAVGLETRGQVRSRFCR